MPIHDWKRVGTWLHHDFRNEWILTIKGALNQLLKGTEYYALPSKISATMARTF